MEHDFSFILFGETVTSLDHLQLSDREFNFLPFFDTAEEFFPVSMSNYDTAVMLVRQRSVAQLLSSVLISLLTLVWCYSQSCLLHYKIFHLFVVRTAQ